MTLFWNIAVIITMVCYAIALAFIFLFSIVQLNLVFAYLREKEKGICRCSRFHTT